MYAKNIWVDAKEEKKAEIFSFSKDYMNFLDEAKTERMATKQAVRLAKEKGFRPLEECKELHPGDKVYTTNEGTPLTIGAAVAQATLTVSNFQLDKTVYTLGDQMKLTADLTLTNGTLYEGTIAAAFFESGSPSTSNVVAKDIRVEGTGKLDWTFTPNITQAGTYNVALYEMTDDGSRQLTSTVGFSVTNPMGIEDEAAAPEQLIIYSQPVEDVLRFATPSTVEQIEIYSLNGGAVKKVTAGAQSGTTCQVEVSTLSSGLYVVKVQTKDGRRLGGKFLKK